jgi:response regulator RpfG family c-di-GMP phosphodiesterase
MNDLSKLHACVIDDQDIELFITEKFLKINKLAGEIALYRSGQEFINAFKEKNHDLDYALINYSMPDMNGIETIQHIRDLKHLTSNTRFFITSSSADFVELNKVALSNVVDGLLLKPLSAKIIRKLLL